MKYTITMEINVSREKTLKLFQDMKFMKKWQPTFVSLEVIEGQSGTVGSKSKLTYDDNGKPSVIIETIIKKDLPNNFDFLYETKGVTNWANNRFIDNGNTTTWIATHEFKFSGLMIFLGLFKKIFMTQTTRDMTLFKKSVEENEAL